MPYMIIWPVFLSITLAAAQTAMITIEASHGGAGSGLANTSIEVPLNTRYQSPALDSVSTLYLTGADRASLESITCTPYRNGNLTGSSGLPFTSSTPSRLSINTVQVGSLFCNSSGSAVSPGSSVTSNLLVSTTGSAGSISPGRNATSILLTTVIPSTSTARPSTITSFATFDGQDGPTTSTYTSVVNSAPSQTTASPSLNTAQAGAARFCFGERVVQTIAVIGLGLAIVV